MVSLRSMAEGAEAEGEAERRKVFAAWRLGRGQRLLWSVPFNLGLLLVIAALLLRGGVEDPRANFEKSRQALLVLAPPHVPDEENANTDYKLAAKAFVNFLGEYEDNPLYHIDIESQFFERKAVLAFWLANAKTIGLLQAGAQKDRCDWNICNTIPWNCPPSLSPFLFQLRQAGELLAVNARCLAHKGDHQGAAKSLAAIHKMARHLESCSNLINLMYACALDADADEALVAIINFDTPATFNDLASYRKAVLPRESPYKQLARSAEIYKAQDLCLLDGMVAEALPIGKNIQPVQINPISYGSDRHCYEAVSNAVIESLLRNETPKDRQELIDFYQTGPVPYTSAQLPDYLRCFWPLLETYDLAILNDTALAFLQFRVRRGRDPKTIGELVPEFLPALPQGAVNGEPVRICRDLIGAASSVCMCLFDYYKGKRAIRLYTVGRNGKDDGGLNDGSYTEKSADDVFIIIPPLPEVGQGEENK